MNITMEEWLSGVRVASKGEAGFSAQELADAMGICKSATLTHLAAAVRAGRVKCAGRAMRTDIAGRGQMVPVYRLVGAARSK